MPLFHTEQKLIRQADAHTDREKDRDRETGKGGSSDNRIVYLAKKNNKSRMLGGRQRQNGRFSFSGWRAAWESAFSPSFFSSLHEG